MGATQKEEMKKRSKQYFLLTKPGWPEPAVVRVMARAEGYALVRRKGKAPFICEEKDLKPCSIEEILKL